MTTEELKKKIDGLFLGLHSTNPGDINAVKDILTGIVNTVAPVKVAFSSPYTNYQQISDDVYSQLGKATSMVIAQNGVDLPFVREDGLILNQTITSTFKSVINDAIPNFRCLSVFVNSIIWGSEGDAPTSLDLAFVVSDADDNLYIYHGYWEE